MQNPLRRRKRKFSSPRFIEPTIEIRITHYNSISKVIRSTKFNNKVYESGSISNVGFITVGSKSTFSWS